MKLGSVDVAALKVGTVNASKAYLGSTLVWEAGGDPDPGATLGGPLRYAETTWGSAFASSAEFGWQFTVGANDITVAALMLYDADGGSETVNLWRVSDQALIASAVVTSPGGWAETEITPVTLSAGASYVVSRYAAGASRNVDSNAGRGIDGNNRGISVDPAITMVGGRFNSSGGFPASASGNLVGVNLRTVAPPSGYRFYRLNVSAVDGGTNIRIDELEYRESLGGSDVTGSGEATESRLLSNSFSSDNLYTGTTAFWLTPTGATTAWAAYDFGSGREKNIVQYTVKTGNTANQSPRDWTLEASHDFESWDVLHTVTGETGWSSGETRTYTV